MDKPSGLRVWHCQTVSTAQPMDFSSDLFRLSRALFRSNFGPQNSGLDFGGLPMRQPWACQKQPLTKITFFRDGKTISGVPGKSFLYSLNRYPSAYSKRRTISSGAVFFPPIRAINALRLSLVLLSVMIRHPVGRPGGPFLLLS